MKWRVIITDTEGLTGVAPVCERQTEPDGPHHIEGPNEDDATARYDESGVYDDCCPYPHIECWSNSNAEDVRVRLDRADAELAGT